MTTLTLADEMEAVVTTLRKAHVVVDARQNDVIRGYCSLSGQVAEGVFHWAQAADCFCKDRCLPWNYQYSDAVLDYIRTAVHEKMQRDGHAIPEAK